MICRFFLARFDLNNYTETPQADGNVMITMRWPEELEAKVKEGQDDRELKMLSLTLSSTARACLSGRKSLQPAEVPEFARQTRRLADWHPSGLDAQQEQYRVNSLAGGIAVLIIQHRDWLRQNPDIEKWCMEMLRELKPAEGSELDSFDVRARFDGGVVPGRGWRGVVAGERRRVGSASCV